MSLKLDWHLDGSPVAVLDDDEPGGLPPAGREPRPRNARSAVFWLLYLAALALVGWGGFAVGRWRDLYEAHRDNLTTQLNIEARAWNAGDSDLYGSTLDAGTLPAWREAEIERFNQLSPAPITLRLIDFTTDPLGRAKVRVEVSRDGQLAIEERTYRLVKGSWYLTTAFTGLPPE